MPRRLPSRTPPVAACRRPTNPGRGGWPWSPGPAGGSGPGMAARFAERGLALGLCARTTPAVPRRGRGARAGGVGGRDRRHRGRGLRRRGRRPVRPHRPVGEQRGGPRRRSGRCGPRRPTSSTPTSASTWWACCSAAGPTPATCGRGRAAARWSTSPAGRRPTPTRAGRPTAPPRRRSTTSPGWWRSRRPTPGCAPSRWRRAWSTPTCRPPSGRRPREDFPSLDRFLGLAQDDAFNSPAWVADRILDLAVGATRRVSAVAAMSSSGFPTSPETASWSRI